MSLAVRSETGESGDNGDAHEEPTLREELLAELESLQDRARQLEEELRSRTHSWEQLTEEVSNHSSKVKGEKDKYTVLWRLNCAQLREFDEDMSRKDGEIHSLRARVDELEAHLGSGTPAGPAITGPMGGTVPGVAVVPVPDPGRDLTQLSPSTSLSDERGAREHAFRSSRPTPPMSGRIVSHKVTAPVSRGVTPPQTTPHVVTHLAAPLSSSDFIEYLVCNIQSSGCSQ